MTQPGNRPRALFLAVVSLMWLGVAVWAITKGAGLDGRDGPERMSLAAVVDAAQDHHHETYQRQLAAREKE